MRLVEVLSRFSIQRSVEGQFQIAKGESIQRRWIVRGADLIMWFNGVLTVEYDEIVANAEPLPCLPS
jgi:hypothetical protein